MSEKRSIACSGAMFMMLITLMLITLAACALPSHEQAVDSVQALKADVPANWAAQAASATTVDDGWIAEFNDPQLVALVDEALANNPNLQAAQAQLDRANALAKQAGAALKPTIGLASGYSGITPQDAGLNSPLYGIGLGISWEADVWGRIRSGVAASEMSARAVAADYAFARQSLAAATASAWFLAIESRLQSQFAADIVALRQQYLQVVTAKQTVGKVSMQDVHLSRADLAAAQDADKKAEIAYENALRSLEVLLGRYPSADIGAADTLTAVPPGIPVGLPSEILERRPDMIAAETRVAAAFYQQREADLLRLPRFTLTGIAGSANLASAIAGLSAGMLAPLYTGGAIEAQIEAADAEQKQALAAYANCALQAFKEVETALATETSLADRESYLKREVEEKLAAWQISDAQYKVGKIDLLDSLTIQNQWIAARIALYDISTNRLLNRVNLHLALGGSFESSDAPAADTGA